MTGVLQEQKKNDTARQKITCFFFFCAYSWLDPRDQGPEIAGERVIKLAPFFPNGE